jgi:hypothetical protein
MIFQIYRTIDPLELEQISLAFCTGKTLLDSQRNAYGITQSFIDGAMIWNIMRLALLEAFPSMYMPDPYDIEAIENMRPPRLVWTMKAL